MIKENCRCGKKRMRGQTRCVVCHREYYRKWMRERRKAEKRKVVTRVPDDFGWTDEG